MGTIIEWPKRNADRCTGRGGSTGDTAAETNDEADDINTMIGRLIGGGRSGQDARSASKHGLVFDGLMRNLRQNQSGARGRPDDTAALPVLADSRNRGFDLSMAEYARPDRVMDLDPDQELLLCVYDKDAPDPVLTFVQNDNGTRTLMANGHAIAQLAASRLEVADVVLYRRNGT